MLNHYSILPEPQQPRVPATVAIAIQRAEIKQAEEKRLRRARRKAAIKKFFNGSSEPKKMEL